ALVCERYRSRHRRRGMKSTIPWLIAATVGVVLIAASFVPAAQSWKGEVEKWFDILAAFAFVLGGANLFAYHLGKISVRRAGWGYSAVTLVAFVATLAAGLFKIGVASARYPGNAWAGPY